MAFRNFDEFVAEKETIDEPITFIFRNEEYEVPGQIGFITRLRLAKMFSKKNKKDQISPSELFELTVAVFGQDNVERLEAARTTETEYMDLMNYVTDSSKVADEASPKEPKVETAVEN